MAKKRKKKKKSSGKSIIPALLLLLLLIGCGLWQMKQSGQNTPLSPTATYNLRHIPDAEMAHSPADRPEQILRRTGYIVSYNPQWKQPNWVSYELLRSELQGSAARTNRFITDHDATGTPADTQDYTRSGYDRGHMAPAADMKWSETAMKESFLLSNICPQNPGLNRGRWKELEEEIRQWARCDSALLIACGPIVDSSRKHIGQHRVAVPDQFFKVIAAPYTEQPRGIAFLFENDDNQPPLGALAVTIDSIETITGIDFFHHIPDSIETLIESNTSLELWNLN